MLATLPSLTPLVLYCFQMALSRDRTSRSFVNHCDTNYLELNVSKTNEMVIDFRQARSDPQPVDIKGSAVARVETYTYLGIVLNNNLSWGDHVDFIVKNPFRSYGNFGKPI